MKQSTLGSCIRALRMQNHMTQVQLAARLSVTDKAVSKWERDVSYPDIALFPRLADVLGVTVDDLLRECKTECRSSKLLRAFEVSRDIRTPLHIMLGFVEIAKNNYNDPETLLKYLEGIKVSGEYLMTLLNNIMEAAGSSDKRSAFEDFPVGTQNLDQYIQDKISTDPKESQIYDFSGKRILIAEDMAVNREIAAEILKQTGAETEFAEDGFACLEKMESSPTGYYDLILMDILMPNMDGLEATRRIRHLEDPKKASIPIIAMTTTVSEKDRNAAFEAGMDAFTEKPIFVDRFYASLSLYLNRKDEK